MLFMAVFALASCLNDDNEYVYTDDSAITAFSVTGAKRYIHTKTKKEGKDSVYTVTSSYTSYKFCIDQNNNTIYNPDSLPCGVDATKLVCTVTGLNSMAVLIKSLKDESLQYISGTDSLDFSQERELQVMSNSGKQLRKYKVKVNIHKEQADSFFWTPMAKNAEIEQFTAVKTCAVKTAEGGVRLFLFGNDGTQTRVYVMNDGQTWRAATPNFNGVLAADAYEGVVTKDNKVYLSHGGNIICTADGNNWQQTGSVTGVKKLVAASPLRLYGYNAEGQLVASADNGATWTVATIDSDAALLPTTNHSYTCNALVTNNDSYRVTLYGTTASGKMAVWGKVDEGAAYSENQPWTYYEVSADNKHALPKLNNMSVATYDGKTYALGTLDGMSEVNTALYSSKDGGLTWAEDTTLSVPTDLYIGNIASGAPRMALTVDSDNFIWIVNAKSGSTWRGRINRLGWKKEQTDFIE